jgi:hypothetical protein
LGGLDVRQSTLIQLASAQEVSMACRLLSLLKEMLIEDMVIYC